MKKVDGAEPAPIPGIVLATASERSSAVNRLWITVKIVNVGAAKWTDTVLVEGQGLEVEEQVVSTGLLVVVVVVIILVVLEGTKVAVALAVVGVNLGLIANNKVRTDHLVVDTRAMIPRTAEAMAAGGERGKKVIFEARKVSC